MKLYPFSQRTLEALQHPPAAGAGRHYWLWDVAYGLHTAGMPIAKVEEFGRTLIQTYAWHDRLKDWHDIIQKLAEGPQVAIPGHVPAAPWPTPCPSALSRMAGAQALFDPATPTDLAAQDVLPELFRLDELVCFGWDQHKYSTDRLSVHLPAADRAEFVVANPMRAPASPSGSLRSSDNACSPYARRQVVVEFDQGDPLQRQAAVLSALSGPLHPLVMAVWSGGKSIHGWYDVTRLLPYQHSVFFRFCVYIGADRSLWDRSKLVRMPGGTRKTGERQAVLYFNIEPYK